jgi:hypothetical protein
MSKYERMVGAFQKCFFIISCGSQVSDNFFYEAINVG